MGAGASVYKGNQHVLKVLYNAMSGLLILNGQIAGTISDDSDNDMHAEDYDMPYAEPHDGAVDDSSSWEPFTNTRGGDPDNDFDDDWTADFSTESE